MNHGHTIFQQLISFLPDREFRRCVSRHQGNAGSRSVSCWDQYLAMAFAQLTYRESLRDIEACLRALGAKRYHMGFRGKVARSTLADANESRNWRIFADFAHVLIDVARLLYAADPIGIDLDQSLYALDSTTIDLCLSLFPWARFRKHKGAVKMHTRGYSGKLLGTASLEGRADGTTVAADSSSKTMMLNPWGSLRLPHIAAAADHFTGMLDHIQRNRGPLATECRSREEETK
jgi:hypothetical protein